MQENDAAISFGIAGFDIGAILGSVLAPAEAYVLPPPPSAIPRRTRKSYGDHSYARSKAPSPVAAYGPQGGAKQSTPVKIRTGNVALEAKFKSAQAKATEVGVENLTKEDIDGLSSGQLKELRGY
jgi:hypothetical protein